jgi:holo-[acyl-carrier protein] synthase
LVRGLGIDLVEIARIENALRRPRFRERILTPAELEAVTTPEEVAGRWAAKEAIIKCIGRRIPWRAMEILPDRFGKPEVAVKAEHLPAENLQILVSITHERTHATAVALMQEYAPPRG